MKDLIQQNRHNPKKLEEFYRQNKTEFKKSFDEYYPEVSSEEWANVWQARLYYTPAENESWNSSELLGIIFASLLAGIIAKIPSLIPRVSESFFYPRNIGFIFLPFLVAYSSIINRLSSRSNIALAIGILFCVFFINFLPDSTTSDTLILSCIHMPLLMLILFGIAYCGPKFRETSGRIEFLRYCGELLIMTGLILIAGAILTGLTFALFSLTELDIYQFYLDWVVIFGLTAAPIVGMYVIRRIPTLLQKVSAIIARIFSPLVLLTLCMYLPAMLFSGKSLNQNREFLLLFNILLLCILAIILFSISAIQDKKQAKSTLIVLLLLSILSVIINGLVLTAVLYRITEWGLTPNRLAVLGGNMLILSNLILVGINLFGIINGKREIVGVERSISRFIPIYAGWAAIVTFLFPFIFGFK